MTTTRTARELAETYFTAWEAGDFDTLRGLLAEHVDFVGALGSASGAEAALAGLKGLGRVLEKIDVKARVAEGDEVSTWFDLHTSVAPPAPTANWMHVGDGKITRIRVTFDPRALLAGLETRN
ncbi:nuclear transport factor 2 family protein [Streptomyces narbonensis]|uniref:Nuclear transport factor 2 family protein n=1 Tax=Streptomyces narbonensis TaxID=67333 RepID=A0ABV3CEH8_9ACTN